MSRLQKLLMREYEEFDDVVILDTPFVEVTPGGNGLQQVYLALTRDNFILSIQKPVSYKEYPQLVFLANTDLDVDGIEVKWVIPLCCVTLTIQDENILKVGCPYRMARYFEMNSIDDRDYEWRCWVKRINYIHKDPDGYIKRLYRKFGLLRHSRKNNRFRFDNVTQHNYPVKSSTSDISSDSNNTCNLSGCKSKQISIEQMLSHRKKLIQSGQEKTQDHASVQSECSVADKIEGFNAQIRDVQETEMIMHCNDSQRILNHTPHSPSYAEILAIKKSVRNSAVPEHLSEVKKFASDTSFTYESAGTVSSMMVNGYVTDQQCFFDDNGAITATKDEILLAKQNQTLWHPWFSQKQNDASERSEEAIRFNSRRMQQTTSTVLDITNGKLTHHKTKTKKGRLRGIFCNKSKEK